MAQIDYKLKIVAIVCFISLTLSNIIAFLHPSKGYELSIYESTPIFVWLFLIISIIGGVTIIIHQVYTKEYKSSNFWMLGFSILILSRISLLYIPFMRGYYSWRDDHFCHIGSVSDIIHTGHFDIGNFYPITHILIAEIRYISGIPIELLVNYSTALFSAFYVVSIYLLATIVLPRRDAQLLSVAAISGVLFSRYNVYLMPNGWSIFYLPLILFFFFKSFKSLEYRLLLVITLVFYPFFHPLSSTVLVIILITIGFTRFSLHVIEQKKISLDNILHSFPINQILIMLGILIPWILSFSCFGISIRHLYTSLTTGEGPNTIAQMGSTLDKLNIQGFEFVKLIIKIMGDEIIFLAISITAAIILLKSYKKNHKELKNSENFIILFSITFIIGIIYAGNLFNIIPGLENINAQRLLSYIVLFTPIFVGYTFQHFLSKKRTHIKALLCILIIMSASIISIYSLYPSPYTLRPNSEVTQMDIDVFEWFVGYKSVDIGCTFIMSAPRKFIYPLLGTTEGRRIIGSYSPTILNPQIPDHFGYTNYSTLGESYRDDRYAVILQIDKICYDTVWKVVGRFRKEDFERLENDNTVDILYTNGEDDVWYIHGNKRM